MDPRFQTSFIPKKPIIAQAKSISSSPINLVTLISTVIFIVVAALSGAAFFYKTLLQKQIAADGKTLALAKEAFDPNLIDKIVRLDNRINMARKLLLSHVSVDPLFEFISSITLKSVRFKNFAFAYASPDKIQVTMTGQAKDYTSVALQSDLFNEQKSFQNVVIGNMTLDSMGMISFDVTATVDSKLLSYSSVINGVSATTTTP